ncbi:ROK family transcriptional regulator [Salinibacterium soli]|uniref:ROK family transcriptional regulator n=1 Tax=Antiquaquibacter soli TaxID=3064523 RepID=A0ABT9BMG9_9MICO|nr:ROK family transcriptional regulator [Protaetiibacter sp. WY-16]MDO7880976.1 ROK family transcriptional regulator [Protaetiibacter sp. WY-16]
MPSRSPTPGSQTSLREANRVRIVESLKHHGHLTQVELAGFTGLSPATVSNIVKELAASGVLNTSVTSRSGRRATEVTLARNLGLVAGLHFSSRHLRVAISDVSKTIVAENHVPLALDHRHDRELDRATLLLSDMLESVNASFTDLLGIGIGLPAPVDAATGRLATGGLLRGWEHVSISEAMAQRVNVPVFVDHEANLGGLAEARSGSARGSRDAAYIQVGHTISAGLIINGAIYRGTSGKAGQIGHITIDENGPICRCGSRGCLDTLAGGPALLELFRDDPGIQRLRDLLLRAESGDASSRRVIADAGRHVGIAAASLSNLFDPELLVIGGELARAGETLLAPLRHALDRSALAGPRGVPMVVQGELGDRAEVLGCLALAIENVGLGADVRPPR